jgi:hypothetical protein
MLLRHLQQNRFFKELKEACFIPVFIDPYNHLNKKFFFYLVYGAIGTADTPGLLCQPQVIVKMIVQK